MSMIPGSNPLGNQLNYPSLFGSNEACEKTTWGSSHGFNEVQLDSTLVVVILTMWMIIIPTLPTFWEDFFHWCMANCYWLSFLPQHWMTNGQVYFILLHVSNFPKLSRVKKKMFLHSLRSELMPIILVRFPILSGDITWSRKEGKQHSEGVPRSCKNSVWSGLNFGNTISGDDTKFGPRHLPSLWCKAGWFPVLLGAMWIFTVETKAGSSTWS